VVEPRKRRQPPRTEEPRVSLRISLSARRCPKENGSNRVRYELGSKCVPPEKLVLRRWQARTKEPAAVKKSIRFDGCRLRPGTWTVFQILTDSAPPGQRVVTADAVRAWVARSKGINLRGPVPEKFEQLIAYLAGRGLLDDVRSRVRDPKSPGLPDLFLYRLDRDGKVFGGIFAEVKRPEERLLPSQREELAFLRELGFKAGVVRLGR
jgi:hypothetical protein